MESRRCSCKSRRLELQYIMHVNTQIGADAIKSYSTPFTRRTHILATNIIEYRFGYRQPTALPAGYQLTFADYIPLNTFTDIVVILAWGFYT